MWDIAERFSTNHVGYDEIAGKEVSLFVCSFVCLFVSIVPFINFRCVSVRAHNIRYYKNEFSIIFAHFSDVKLGRNVKLLFQASFYFDSN